MQSTFLKNLREHEVLLKTLVDLDDHISQAVGLITLSFQNEKKLLLCGNGGSAADSQHIAAEFLGRFIKDRKALAAIALTTDTSALTCISNDYAFDEVFSRQISGLGQKGDCLLAISTSGNSINIVNAVREARTLGIKTIGLLGRDGGELLKLCDVALVVESDSTARIQEAHILIAHSICGDVELKLGLV